MFKIDKLFTALHSFSRKQAARFGALTLSTIILAGTLQIPVQAASISTDINEVSQWPKGPSVTAEAAILLEANTGAILYSKNIHKQEYPASCTKILTCLIASERCELDELVYMSHDAVYDTPRGSNHIALDVGEAITVEQALSAILVRSANEVSFAVGEHISGTTWQDFGPIMTEKAKELGALNSNFVNPNGLPDDNHYTTAYDLATIARYFFDNELLAKLSRSTKLEIPATDLQPDNIVEHTKNRLLPGQKYAYENLVGSKTGYTDAARNCLVSCAEKDGLKLICVVLRDSSPDHYKDTISLFDWGFSNFKAVNIAENERKYNISDSGLFYSDNDVFGSSKPLLTLNQNDYIVLPNTAAFEETVSSISYGVSDPFKAQTADKTTASGSAADTNSAALITYTWNDVIVGTASIHFTADAQTTFDFDTILSETSGQGTDTESSSESTEEDTNSSPQENSTDKAEKKTSVFMKLLKIVLIVIAVLLLCVILLIVLIFIRNYRIHLARSRKYHHNLVRVSTPKPRSQSLRETLRENAERRKRYRARQARIKRNKKAGLPPRYRDTQ